MSSNGNSGKPTAPVANPYARKRPAPSSNPLSDTSGNAPASVAPSFQGASSFSQAFQSIDETSHFKEQQSSVTRDPNVARMEAEQRAHDLKENQEQKEVIEFNMSDKDHHVLLQPHMLYVSTKQRGNGVLKFIRNVPYAYSKMTPDYIMSSTSCALFLSIKYHQLYPHYIHRRLGELKTDFKVRVLLVLVDVEDNTNALLYLNKLSVTNNMTLILAWSEHEAARYLETFKALNGKDASIIQRKEANNYVDQVSEFLTGAKPVNKTDSANLLSHFSNVRAIMAASKDELALCPGLGHVKVQKLHDACHKPFSMHAAANLKKQRFEKEKKEEVLTPNRGDIDGEAEEEDEKEES
jgi:DNA excision repair protein ERCC-1